MAREGPTEIDPVWPYIGWQLDKLYEMRACLFLLVLFVASPFVRDLFAQDVMKTLPLRKGSSISVVNFHGRVVARTDQVPSAAVSQETGVDGSLSIVASSPTEVLANELVVTSAGQNLSLKVEPFDRNKRVDLVLSMPAGCRLKIETGSGEVRIEGDIIGADVRTDTGTIAVDVPTDDVRYRLLWTASRPRYLSDFELEPVRERSAGRFEISGSFREVVFNTLAGNGGMVDRSESSDGVTNIMSSSGRDPKTSRNKSNNGRPNPGSGLSSINLNLQTARGIILINIPPGEVTGDLRERPLTEAAKAIIRSGDSLLMEAIRRAAPKFYGDYTRTLPPIKLEPSLTERKRAETAHAGNTKIASIRVSDEFNRAVGGLAPGDLEVFENGKSREILDVRPSTASFNLVLLLDVSGSVENYVNFIRKAARNFVETVDGNDRISIITFNDDVTVVSPFTTDKGALSKSLDSFDAGGATAFYDALAYTLADTLRPLKGERTAIVVLTDGDDNRSFLPFDSMLSSIEESGALIYPLYVPSGLIAAFQTDPNASVDSLRQRYLRGQLTSRAKDEGKRLAKASGGVYYEIERLSQIQAAYEDIVLQLRMAYDVEYSSEIVDSFQGVPPRLKINVRRPNSYVQIRSVSSKEFK